MRSSSQKAARPLEFHLQKVAVRYGPVEALRDVTLRLGAGERLALVGPSGGGKSTLLRLLVGGVRAAAGSVSAGGVDLGTLEGSGLRELRSRVGFIHQTLGLVPNLRVVQNVAAGRLGRLGFWAAARHVLLPPRAVQRDIQSLLERVGIGGMIHQRTDRLSGGQQQRVALARALWQQPEVLLADEPVSSLDPARARAVLSLLARMSEEEGLTLCVSLHQFDLAREFFPRLVGLRDGAVLFDKGAAEVGEEEFARLYDLSGLELAGGG